MLKEFKVVSTGEDIAAQISAINNFIDSAATTPWWSTPRTRPPSSRWCAALKQAGVVLVAFDNTIDTDEAINVNVDQEGLGKYWGDFLVKSLPNGGKHPRGAGRRRHLGRQRSAQGHPGYTEGLRQAVRDASKWWASGTTARPRRCRPTPLR